MRLASAMSGCKRRMIKALPRASGKRAKSPRTRQSAAIRSISKAAQLRGEARSEEHTSELQSPMRISYAVFCLKKKKSHHNTYSHDIHVLHIHQHDYTTQASTYTITNSQR